MDFDGKFLDEQIEESFAVQTRTSTIVMIFAAIAILISLLGLLAMSTYFIQQRAAEIAVRKVFWLDKCTGASPVGKGFPDLCGSSFYYCHTIDLAFYERVAYRLFVPYHTFSLDLCSCRTVLP